MANWWDQKPMASLGQPDPSRGRGFMSGQPADPWMAPTSLGIKPPSTGYIPPPWAGGKPPDPGGYQPPPWAGGKLPDAGGYEPPPWAGQPPMPDTGGPIVAPTGPMMADPVKGASTSGYQPPPWSTFHGNAGMAGAPSFAGPDFMAPGGSTDFDEATGKYRTPAQDSRVNRPGGPTQQTLDGSQPDWMAPNSGGAAPQAGQFANTNQGFLDWATQRYGADPQRGGGFVNAQAGGGIQNMLREYNAATGNQANYLAGPSGDRVDFGQGVQDAMTSGGQIWNAQGGDPSNGRGYNSGNPGSGELGQWMHPMGGGDDPSGGRGWDPGMLQAPGPFTYTPSNLGQFQGPSPYQVPSPFSYNGQVPNAPNLQAQQHGTPERLQYQQYNGAPGDSSYDFRFNEGLRATENALAHSGALRSGNAVKALTDYGQGAASTEYAAEDARRRANVGMNNDAALAFGQANIGNQFNATQANNANALGFGNANFQNAMAAQGQGYGQAANTHQMNAQLGMQGQNQNFNQSLAGYGANQAAQNQMFNQALAAYGMNANTGLGYGSQNQQYALGQRGLDLGFQNSRNSYNLGMGNLGVAQGQLGLAQQGQNFNQGLASWEQNYRSQVTDPWNMNYQLAQLGNPGAPNGQGYANALSDYYAQQGNANAAGQIGQGNASSGMWSNLGLSAQQIAYLQSLNQGSGGGGV